MSVVESSLLEQLRQSNNKKHTLICWITDWLNDVSEESASKVIEEIWEFFSELVTLEPSECKIYESQVIANQLSQLCAFCLDELHGSSPGKVFDTASKMCSILSEDTAVLVKDEEEKKRLSKVKHTHVYSCLLYTSRCV